MKKILFVLAILPLLVSVTYAGLAPTILPESSHYQGQHDRSFTLDSGGTLDIHLEFAVYSYADEVSFQDGTSSNEAEIMSEWSGYTGEADYVYAYQVFCEASNNAALTYFALTGVDSSTIADIQNDIGQSESLDGGATQSGGVAPISSQFNTDVTKAIWEFDDGAIVQGDRSWFLFLYSDYDWIAGDIEVQARASDDVPTPGVPEPATISLLICGTILSLKRRK